MYRMKWMYLQFLKEPIWFKLIIIISLLASITFSSSLFSYNNNYQSLSKISAGIFFTAYGFKMRNNRTTSVIFFITAILCLILAWYYFDFS